jgi:hypothetical protein
MRLFAAFKENALVILPAIADIILGASSYESPITTISE